MPFSFNLLGFSTQRHLEGPSPPTNGDNTEPQLSRNKNPDHIQVLHKKTVASKTANSVADANGVSTMKLTSSSPEKSDSTAGSPQLISRVTQSDERKAGKDVSHKQTEPSYVAFERTRDDTEKRRRHYQEPTVEESSRYRDVHSDTPGHSATYSPNHPAEYAVKELHPGFHREKHLWSWVPHLRQSADDRSIVANVREVFVLAEQYVNNFYVNRPCQELPEDFPPALTEMSFPHLPFRTPVTDLLRQVHCQDTVIKHCLVSIILSTISLDCDSSYSSLLPLEFIQLPKALQKSTASERRIPYLQAALSAHRVLSHYIRPNVTDDQNYLRERDAAIDTVAISFEAAFIHWENGSRPYDQRIPTLVSLLRKAADLGILLFTQASTFLFDWKIQSAQANEIEIPIWPRMLKIYDEEARELDPAQHMFKMKTGRASFISDVKSNEDHDKPLAKVGIEGAPDGRPTAITEPRSNFTAASILQDRHEKEAVGCCAETKLCDLEAPKFMSSPPGVHRNDELFFFNSDDNSYQAAAFNSLHDINGPGLMPLQQQNGVVMHGLGPNIQAGVHENLPVHVSELGEDQTVRTRLHSASDHTPVIHHEMPGEVDKCKDLPPEPAELEDAAPRSQPNNSNAADRPNALPERHHRGRRQRSDSATEQESREPVELPGSAQVTDTDPRGPVARSRRPSQQHAIAQRSPTRERELNCPPSSFPPALLNDQALKRKMVGSSHLQSTGPPSPRPPPLKDGRARTWSCASDADNAHPGLQIRHHHNSHSRSPPKSGDRQRPNGPRKSMDVCHESRGSLLSEVLVDYRIGIDINHIGPGGEPDGSKLVNKNQLGRRPSSSDPGSSTTSSRGRQNSMRSKKPTVQWKFLGGWS